MLKSWYEKLFSKKKNTNSLYIILIIGIVIVVFGGSLFGGLGLGKSPTKTANNVLLPDKTIEKELSDILSQIRGAGKVEIMITYVSTGEKIYVTDVSEQTKTSNQDTKSGDVKEDSDTKYDRKTITPSNAPVVSKELFPKVKGVIVVAQGADDAAVRQNIMQAVKAALDVPDHKISVLVKR